MVSMIDDKAKTILEPTPGEGNLINAVKERFSEVNIIAPENYFDWEQQEVDCTIMNPPFTDKQLITTNASHKVRELKGMAITGYFVYEAMKYSKEVIALIPYYFIINSAKRVEELMKFGFVSLTNLPRGVFGNLSVQVCVIHLRAGHSEQTLFKNYKRS